MSSPAFAHILCYEMIKKNSMEYPFVLPLPLPPFFPCCVAVWWNYSVKKVKMMDEFGIFLPADSLHATCDMWYS